MARLALVAGVAICCLVLACDRKAEPELEGTPRVEDALAVAEDNGQANPRSLAHEPTDSAVAAADPVDLKPTTPPTPAAQLAPNLAQKLSHSVEDFLLEWASGTLDKARVAELFADELTYDFHGRWSEQAPNRSLAMTAILARRKSEFSSLDVELSEVYAGGENIVVVGSLAGTYIGEHAPAGGATVRVEFAERYRIDLESEKIVAIEHFESRLPLLRQIGALSIGALDLDAKIPPKHIGAPGRVFDLDHEVARRVTMIDSGLEKVDGRAEWVKEHFAEPFEFASHFIDTETAAKTRREHADDLDMTDQHFPTRRVGVMQAIGFASAAVLVDTIEVSWTQPFMDFEPRPGSEPIKVTRLRVVELNEDGSVSRWRVFGGAQGLIDGLFSAAVVFGDERCPSGQAEFDGVCGDADLALFHTADFAVDRGRRLSDLIGATRAVRIATAASRPYGVGGSVIDAELRCLATDACRVCYETHCGAEVEVQVVPRSALDPTLRLEWSGEHEHSVQMSVPASEASQVPVVDPFIEELYEQRRRLNDGDLVPECVAWADAIPELCRGAPKGARVMCTGWLDAIKQLEGLPAEHGCQAGLDSLDEMRTVWAAALAAQQAADDLRK